MQIISLVGPTSSGKTDIAIEIAKVLDGEIISADSRQVYRDFDIGTAKPSMQERQGIAHHLIDVAPPTFTYSVSDFVTAAESVIEDISQRGKTPIIAGGTGFYIKALLEGLDIPKVAPDEDFRTELRDFALKYGNDLLYQKLVKIDSVAAQKLHPNDVFRVIRALEINKHTGELPSEQQVLKESKYQGIYFGLNAQDRAFLYDKINSRTDVMLEKGLVNEVEGLAAKYGRELKLLDTLGYKEVCEYLDGDATIDEARAKIQKNTRNYAKRQLTWFGANPKIKWYHIDTMAKEEIAQDIIKCLSTM
ncbi:MAG: tRNA (adenosine(37)-N6)-dimethylallyltransferase MiaA [Candidatus Gastranaerophilales bacterium]|nr:tRNA (adenosine(37)-N6)-dimethylallyltransferase MiaA [Candidatus Gastranaerophilales bacterium]